MLIIRIINLVLSGKNRRALKFRLCRNKVERTKNVARVRKIKKLNYKTVQLWTKADLWRQVSFAFSESYAWFQYPQ